MSKKRTVSSKDQPAVKLERIYGFTSLSRVNISSNIKGDLFYSAGNTIVRYNINENKQKLFYSHSNRAITCQAISDDEKYLAYGERGHQPSVVVWDIERNEKVVVLNSHKFGVSCLNFSPNSKYLVSVGFKHDRQLIVWDWYDSKIITIMKLTNKVYSITFQPEGNYFVTCGDRHLKWWYLEDTDNDSIEIIGKPASILEDHKNAIFMDIFIHLNFVYSVTSTGILCRFDQVNRMMDTWIQVESSTCYSLTLIN